MSVEAFGGAYRVQDSSYPVLQLVPPSSEYWPTIVIWSVVPAEGRREPVDVDAAADGQR